MSERAKPHSANPRAGLSWDMAPFAAAEDRIFDASALANQPFPLTHLVWCKMQQSAQQIDDGGRFELSRGRLASLGHVDLAAIDSILSAFAEVGLIVEGRCATFIERALSRDQRHRQAAKSKAATPPAADAAGSVEPGAPASGDADVAPATREPPESASPRRGRDAPGPASDAGASRKRTESESSESRHDRDSEVPSVIVFPGCRARASGPVMTDDEIIDLIVDLDPSKLPRRVVSKGVGRVRKWLADGLDFDLEILPELTEIAGKLNNPLSSLDASFITEQIRSRAANRIAPGLAPGRPPPERNSKKPTSADISARVIYGNSASGRLVDSVVRPPRPGALA